MHPTTIQAFADRADYLNGAQNMTRLQACNKAKRESMNGYVQHVNLVVSGSEAYYIVSDWFDSDWTVVSFENGRMI